MKTKVLMTLFGGALLAAGCDATPKKVDDVEPRNRPPVQTVNEPTMPVDHPDTGALQVLSRGPRRMSVEQLERTLERIADFPKFSIEIPENLALTMGKPDYLRITEESLDPSPLYMKFLVDLGGFYCQGVAEADLGMNARPANQRLLNRVDGDVDGGIRHMVLMFTGIEGAEADDYVTRLRAAYDTGASGALGDVGGWQAVCLSMFTAPESILY